MRALIAAITSLLSRARFERDMREELSQHVEYRADDLVAGGVPRGEALRQARVEFGAVEAYKEECRDAGGFAPLRVFHGFGSDLRLAGRRLLATPMFTIFAVLSLAVGVGVTTAAYSVVDAVFWRQLQIPDPDSAVVLMSAGRARADPRWIVSRPDLEDLAAAQRSFSALATALVIYPPVEGTELTEIQPAEGVDGDYFQVIGVRPLLGRFIQPSDATPQAEAVVVLSHGLWRSRFGEDPRVIGRTMRIGGRVFEMIGVAPEGFEGPLPQPRGSRLWISLPQAESLRFPTPSTTPRDRRHLTVVARLRPGVDASAATAEVAAIGQRLDAMYPRVAVDRAGIEPRGWSVRSVHDINPGADTLRRFGLLTLAIVALVLAVACTNLANLVLARGTTRFQEMAVRRALGAARWRLVREQVAESVVLAVLGAIAVWPVLAALRSAMNLEVPIARNWVVSVQPELSAGALVVAACAVLLCVLVFGLEPALNLTRKHDVRAELAMAPGSVGVPKVSRQRKLLRWQVAVSTAFFIVAILCVRYLATEARHESGMDLDRMAVAGVDFNLQRWDEARAREAIDRILDETRRQPAVEAVAVASGLPFGTTITPRAIISYPSENGDIRKPDRATAIVATPGFFRATGITILRGRGFDARDSAGAPPVMVVGESTARHLFGTADVVGRQLLVAVASRDADDVETLPKKLMTIAGVAEDTDTTHFLLRRGSTVYLPFAQEYSPLLTLVARAERSSTAIGALRAGARLGARDLGIDQPAGGYAALAGPYVFLRTLGLVALTLALVTLLLGMAGLYGVQSHIVAYRTREIGVRMSLGATAAQVRAMVLKDGYTPVFQGLAIGLFIGMVGRAIVRSYMTDRVDVVDPWTLLVVPVPLLLAAFCACYLPARRASRVDPNVALRHL